MSRDKVAKKIQQKAERRAARKLPPANEAPEALPPSGEGEQPNFDPVKDSPGGE